MYGMNVSVNVDVDLLQTAKALDADQTCIRSRFLVTIFRTSKEIQIHDTRLAVLFVRNMVHLFPGEVLLD